MADGSTTRADPRRRRPGWSLRLWLLAAAVLAVLAVSTGAVATFATRGLVEQSTVDLTHRLRPAQSDTQELLTAYVDEETGQRGFILTGDEQFLAPYRLGERQVGRLEARLAELLSKDPEAMALLRQVRAAGDSWQQRTRSEIQQVKANGTGALRDVRIQRQDKAIFDRLRDRLDELRVAVNGLVDAEVNRLSTAQNHLDSAMVVALGLSISALACTVALLWLALTRPLGRLLDQLDAVASGDNQRTIGAGGPSEIRRMAEAAETMRVSIVDRSAELARAEHALGVQAERQRVAADLHDTTIQRLFGLGLKLSAVASQRTELATTLNALIEEADEIIRELRRMIFELEAGAGQRPGGASGPGAGSPAGSGGHAPPAAPAPAPPAAGPPAKGERATGDPAAGDPAAEAPAHPAHDPSAPPPRSRG